MFKKYSEFEKNRKLGLICKNCGKIHNEEKCPICEETEKLNKD